VFGRRLLTHWHSIYHRRPCDIFPSSAPPVALAARVALNSACTSYPYNSSLANLLSGVSMSGRMYESVSGSREESRLIAAEERERGNG
jgi:hypothetical protein